LTQAQLKEACVESQIHDPELGSRLQLPARSRLVSYLSRDPSRRTWRDGHIDRLRWTALSGGDGPSHSMSTCLAMQLGARCRASRGVGETWRVWPRICRDARLVEKNSSMAALIGMRSGAVCQVHYIPSGQADSGEGPSDCFREHPAGKAARQEKVSRPAFGPSLALEDALRAFRSSCGRTMV
jgi:hypothetical protein